MVVTSVALRVAAIVLAEHYVEFLVGFLPG